MGPVEGWRILSVKSSPLTEMELLPITISSAAQKLLTLSSSVGSIPASEAIRETALDVQEGADIIMVKPALAYLDLIQSVRETFRMPTAAYNVSGEFSMVKAAAANGWIDEKKVALEILTAIKRAGAEMIITYHAKDAAHWLKE